MGIKLYLGGPRDFFFMSTELSHQFLCIHPDARDLLFKKQLFSDEQAVKWEIRGNSFQPISDDAALAHMLRLSINYHRFPLGRDDGALAVHMNCHMKF